MAYELTSVPVARSQEGIRKLIMSNGGNAIAFVSQSDPPSEGFEAQITIEGVTYRIRVMAQVRDSGKIKGKDQAIRRVWRVLFYHMKGIYESSSTGVMEFRELMLPYIVVKDGRTIGNHLIPKLDEAVHGRPERMLGPAPDGAA